MEPTEPQSSPDVEPQPLAPILVVDDSPEFGPLLKEFLAAHGYNHRVEHYTNGQLALDRLEEFRATNQLPALIITDINMPVLSGLELIGRLKEPTSPYRHIPIIVWSAISLQEVQSRLRQQLNLTPTQDLGTLGIAIIPKLPFEEGKPLLNQIRHSLGQPPLTPLAT